MTGQVFRPVGRTSPTTSPGTSAAPSKAQGRGQWDPADIAAEVNAQIFQLPATPACRWAAAIADSSHPALAWAGATDGTKDSRRAMANRRVAIVGARLSDCGRVDDKTAFQLHYQGTTRALADAGIDKSEVDGFMSLDRRAPAGRARRVSRHAGPTGWTRPVTAAASGSSWSSTRRPPSRRAWSRSSCSPTGRRSGPTSRRSCAWRTSPSGTGDPIQFDAPFGHPVGRTTPWWPDATCTSSAPPSSSWPRWRSPPATTPGFNPDAYYRDPITIDDVVDVADDRGTRSPSSTAASAPTVAAPSCSPTRSAPGTAPTRPSGCSAPGRPSRTRP